MKKFLSRSVSLARWKLYRLGMRLSLGKTRGFGASDNHIYSIPEGCASEEVASHVDRIKRISDAYIQRYGISGLLRAGGPKNISVFAEIKPVPARNLYLLSNVAVSAETGAMWVRDKFSFVESLGNNLHFYVWGGLKDMMRAPVKLPGRIVTPCANLGYYHWLLDAMAQVLIARREAGADVKVLASSHSFRFVREGMAFFGIGEDDIIWMDGPVEAEKAVMVARNTDLGVVFKDNADVLRQEIFKRLDRVVAPFRKIYISRRLERNRAIKNEDAVENAVRRAGFEVCYFEKMPFAEQMKMVSEAKIIMGVHGAGLSNMIAGREGLKVMELLNPAYFNPCFAQLASQLGFDYRCAMLKHDNGAVFADIREIERLICEEND